MEFRYKGQSYRFPDSFTDEQAIAAIQGDTTAPATDKDTAVNGEYPLGQDYTPGTELVGPKNQGFLESANVNTVQEVTNLITAQRAYEMNSKVIQASDDMMGALNQLR